MAFVILAIAGVAWSLVVIRWTITSRGRLTVLLLSLFVLGAATVSMALDVRRIHLARTADRSALFIGVVRRQDWWQLDYRRDGVAFTTANEQHLPAGTLVTLSWGGHPAPVIDNGVCLPLTGNRYAMVARSDTTCRFGRHRIRVVVEPSAQFEAWLRNEARPAHAGSPLFVDAGCAYCHVVRGVASSPSKTAPELTHFARRVTIAATDLPNTPGNLAGWIVNSGALKSGSEMPQNRLSPAVLHSLVDYLESLR